ncbi:hypothetical protein [Streptomyces sp. SGAir0957]
MGRFSKDDKVTVTNPVEPTAHKGGETGTVVGTTNVSGTEVVQFQDDRDGSVTGVYPEEITHR